MNTEIESKFLEQRGQFEGIRLVVILPNIQKSSSNT
jgi:hypothetical protein